MADGDSRDVPMDRKPARHRVSYFCCSHGRRVHARALERDDPPLYTSHERNYGHDRSASGEGASWSASVPQRGFRERRRTRGKGSVRVLTEHCDGRRRGHNSFHLLQSGGRRSFVRSSRPRRSIASETQDDRNVCCEAERHLSVHLLGAIAFADDVGAACRARTCCDALNHIALSSASYLGVPRMDLRSGSVSIHSRWPNPRSIARSSTSIARSFSFSDAYTHATL